MTVQTWHTSKRRGARVETVEGLGRVLISARVSGRVGVGSDRVSVYVDTYTDGETVHAVTSSYCADA